MKRLIRPIQVAAWAAASSISAGHICSHVAAQQSVFPESEYLYWSRSDFSIPFHVDTYGTRPSAVQLETSLDGGRSWSIVGRDSVDARQFRYSAAQDGAYWFRILTLDENGTASPPHSNPLKVMVDTQSPELSLSIDTDTRGDMVAAFVIRDANPSSNNIRLEYQTEDQERWASIPFTLGAANLREVSGQGKWTIPANTKTLVVRLVVRDAAGNESEITRLPQVPRTAFGNGGLQFASGAAMPRFEAKYPSAPSSPSALLQGPPLIRSNDTSPVQGNVSSSSINPSSPKPNDLPLTNEARKLASTPLIATSLPTTGPYELRSIEELMPKQEGSSLSTDVIYLDEPQKPDSSPSDSVSKNLSTPPISHALPGIDAPYFSASKSFSLDYELDLTSGPRVASVELWGTINGGATWERWGNDPDGQSPFDITVETEGLFGFRMVIVGGNGLASNRPRNGDNADAWIHVDTTKPQARITSALYGRGAESGSMVIEFTAKDDFFGERPLSLSYSELPTGPWTTIAHAISNDGRFVWPADPSLPRRVFLKLEAHDQAGNIGENRLDVPVDIEGLAPRGRIQGFRPIPAGS